MKTITYSDFQGNRGDVLSLAVIADHINQDNYGLKKCGGSSG